MRVDALRRDVNNQLGDTASALTRQLAENARIANEQLTGVTNAVTQQLAANTKTMNDQLSNNTHVMNEQLAQIRGDNQRQLDEIRATVDERLTRTLNDRLSVSFKQINENLEAVYKGLGDMQGLAAGVGDLKKTLSNVKTRGILGEVQLGAILSEITRSLAVCGERRHQARQRRPRRVCREAAGGGGGARVASHRREVPGRPLCPASRCG